MNTEDDRERSHIKALEQANADITEEINREYSRYEKINDRALQLLGLNGLFPALFILLTNSPNLLFSFDQPYFLFGSFLIVTSILISLFIYFFNRSHEENIHENEFEEKVIDDSISEGEYLNMVLHRKLDILEHYHENNNELKYPLFFALLSFLVGAGGYIIQILFSLAAVS
ncbi:hypothetical protein ACFFQF_27420 [Haladaptatus pallidirubidus]|uniref:Uncharacterized protein n=1 Tax=Haladaptatus pallidirubidus TaxID=1008152 RepID=A0AAV3UIY4_9EURY|nr:hypothetical protein [Haladaptatus pallidirubidus]